VRDNLARDIYIHRSNARDGCKLIRHLLSDALDYTLSRITQYNIERNIAAIYPDISCLFALYIILAGAEIGDLTEYGLYLLLRNNHSVTPLY
jgi:hypothetical protein